jgi:hypothetical protein
MTQGTFRTTAAVALTSLQSVSEGWGQWKEADVNRRVGEEGNTEECEDSDPEGFPDRVHTFRRPRSRITVNAQE